MQLVVDKSFLGTSKNLIIKDSLVGWSDSHQGDFSFGAAHSHIESIEPLLKLFGVEISEFIPSAFVNAMETCGSSVPPWKKVMPKALYNERLKKLVSELIKAESVVTSSPYFEVYKESQALFNRLVPSTLNTLGCKLILEREDNHVLRNILSGSSKSVCYPPVYDRVSTKTGRLTIKDGPQVLTLKKEYRGLFVPSTKGSAIYEVDFSSLEPRVASNIAGRDPGSDVYSSFLEHYGIQISRDAAKLAVLCSLYGASQRSLQSQLDNQGSNIKASKLVKMVNDYFCVSNLEKVLSKSAKEHGRIENFFGRPILVDDARPAVLLNNFLQSTAVDVALLGFEDFCSKLTETIRPLFVIHDALFFEAEISKLDKISEYLLDGFSIEGFGRFPLKITELKSDE